MKPVRAGLWGSGLFLTAFLAVYGLLMVSARINPGDSGEGGILLLPFLYPWFLLVMAVPWVDRHAAWMSWVFLGLNVGVVFLACSGVWAAIAWLRSRRGSPPAQENERRPHGGV